MLRLSSTLCALLAILSFSRAEEPARAKVEFERDVRPILVTSCVSCHGPEKSRGGLRLDRKSSALLGGDSGAVILPGKAHESLLVKLVSGTDPDRLMPPKGERLTEAQISILRAWIDQGAVWPSAATETDERDWWSLRPLTRPAVPRPRTGADRVSTPIDAFIRAKLEEKGLTPSPEADRRTLIRRVTFDLIGLPPTPEEIDAFINDRSPKAYETVVNRLLGSPQHGERWARHWLDVVHYGDTHGYDKDKPRPNAWPYRDYVIRSFNADKPYGRFVQEQLAGDVLFPGTTDGITALGFIAAGPWDYIGHAEVPETKIDGKIARHLDRDDMVATTMQTFVSLTVQCAQCHHHKFDPIRQEDYYRLQAVFAAIDRADRPYFRDTSSASRHADLTARRAAILKRKESLQAEIEKAAGVELKEIEKRITSAGKPSAPRPEHGYHSAISPRQDSVKWVQVDLGRSESIDRVVLSGCHDTFNNIGAGFGFPLRYKVEVSDDPTFAASTLLLDRTAKDITNPGIEPQEIRARVDGRYVRVTATKLAPRKDDFIFALAELSVHDAAGKNLAAAAPVNALDSIEAPVRWRKSNLTDGFAPGLQTSEELPKLRKRRQELLDRVPSATTTALAEATRELARLDGELAKVRPAGLVYAGTVHTGAGSFRGTGPSGIPRPIHVLRRGDVRTPAAEVAPGTLNVLPDCPGAFDLPPGHREGDRRAALARWLTDSRNALAWRSIVNRVWQYHFGRGLVATPNDFGRMGQLPSHPELLDWLAVEFRDGGQSLKSLHRMIVTSATYRQSSSGDRRAETIDAGNMYLWRMPRRKLEAEAVRDAALAVAGKLDLTRYGPAFQDFVVEHPEHSPHYQYHLADPADAKNFRRSVYRFLVRSRPQPFMTVLDCADPSMQVEKRNESLSPLQALALFNNGFMLTMAKHLAARVEKSTDPVSTAFRLAIGRPPSATEKDSLTAYVREHGLAAACRLILNLNEFVFVD